MANKKPTDGVRAIAPAPPEEDVEMLGAEEGDALDKIVTGDVSPSVAVMNQFGLTPEAMQSVLGGPVETGLVTIGGESGEPEVFVPHDEEDLDAILTAPEGAAFLKKLMGRLEDMEARFLNPTNAAPMAVAPNLREMGRQEGLTGLINGLPALTEGRPVESVRTVFQRRITTLEGRNGGLALGKAITRQLDYAAGDAELRLVGTETQRRATQEARCELARQLSKLVAQRLEMAAEKAMAYGDACAKFALAKGESEARLGRKERPTIAEQKVLPVARREREAARVEFTQALLNAWLVITGGEE